MSLIGPVPRPEITDKHGKLLGPWFTYMSLMNNLLQFIGGNGATASRPTTSLYVGYQFFDTTLGIPVWVKTVGPPAVWINGAGSVV